VVGDVGNNDFSSWGNGGNVRLMSGMLIFWAVVGFIIVMGAVLIRGDRGA